MPPKYSVPQVVGVHQGEKCDICGTEIWREEEIFQRAGIFGGGGGVSTVGLDEEKVKKYIKEQEMSDAQLDLMTT